LKQDTETRMEVVREDKEQRKEENLLMGKCGR
jgi:hypothetical protein